MDIRQCFDILELARDATIDEAKQAYKDLVNIWHPDRFSNNPRLRQKAEERLKEVNEAYETVKSFLSLRKPLEPEKAPRARTESKAEAETSAKAKAEAEYHKAQAETEAKDKIEAFVEAGTGIVLGLFSYLSSVFRRIVAEAKTEVDQGGLKQGQKGDDIRGKGRGRGVGRGKRMGRGRGMGRGGGGRGRGRG